MILQVEGQIVLLRFIGSIISHFIDSIKIPMKQLVGRNVHKVFRFRCSGGKAVVFTVIFFGDLSHLDVPGWLVNGQ